MAIRFSCPSHGGTNRCVIVSVGFPNCDDLAPCRSRYLVLDANAIGLWCVVFLAASFCPIELT